MEVRSVAGQIGNLLGGDSALSANGRADIDSKWTADERRDPEFGKTFQSGVDELAAHLRLFHLDISPKDFWVMSCHLNGHNDSAKTAASQAIYDSSE